jgi:TolB-like protein
MKTIKRWMVVLILGFAGVAFGAGEAKSLSTRPSDTQTATSSSNELTVAILDFEARDGKNTELGKQLTEVLTAMLSGQPNLRLVDRASLERTLSEHELNLTGLVSTEQAIQVGKLVGAKMLITGRAFPMGEQVFITAKIIGTETTRVEGVMVRGKSSGDLGELAMTLAEKLSVRLDEIGPELVAGMSTSDNFLQSLKKQFKGRTLPTVAVIVTEQHIARQIPATADPAVETEIKLLLRECGFTVLDVNQNELADWAKDWKDWQQNPWPRSLDRAEVIVTGEAFSEYATRIGNLVSCAARAEINVIEREDGRILWAGRTTSRAVDLSENIAGRKSLQKAGRILGLEILESFAKSTTTQPVKP